MEHHHQHEMGDTDHKERCTDKYFEGQVLHTSFVITGSNTMSRCYLGKRKGFYKRLGALLRLGSGWCLQPEGSFI